MNLRQFNRETRKLELATGLYKAYRPDDDHRQWAELSEKEQGCWCECAAYVESMLKRRR